VPKYDKAPASAMIAMQGATASQSARAHKPQWSMMGFIRSRASILVSKAYGTASLGVSVRAAAIKQSWSLPRFIRSALFQTRASGVRLRSRVIIFQPLIRRE